MRIVTLVRLPVESVGPLAGLEICHETSAGRTFRVHSRFERVLNLVDETGKLVGVLDSHLPDFPRAIRVTLPPGWDWRTASRAGETVMVKNGTFRAGAWSANSRGAPRWQPTQTSGREVVSPGDLFRTSAMLAADLKMYCVQHDVRSAIRLFPGSRGRKPDLHIDSTQEHLVAELGALTGLGNGLTPDGDDFILGHVAALWPWRHVETIRVHLTLVCSIGERMLDRTTDISRHFLELAFQGHYSQPVDRLNTVLLKGLSETVIRNAANSVMQYGSSSGAVCMAGYLNGIASLETIEQTHAI